MAISRIDFHGFRNLENQRLVLCSGVNVFWGENGSGKTSLLEAVHCLLTGKSFRGARPEQIAKAGQQFFSLYGELQSEGAEIHSVGLTRDINQRSFRLQIDGMAVSTLSELAVLQPVCVIDPGALEIVVGPAVGRRQLMDWGVFHVEHADLRLWSRYAKALEQRNRLLRDVRMSADLATPWNQELARSGSEIDQYRRRYLARLTPVFLEVLATLTGERFAVELKLAAGWDVQRPLFDYLAETFEADRQAGYTTGGPHRADLRITSDAGRVSQFLSRGQSKMVVVALKLAQGIVLDQVRNASVLYLIDDLHSELDQRHRQAVWRLLHAFPNQVLMTGVDASCLDGLEAVRALEGSGRPLKVFHVEHGRISETPQRAAVATSENQTLGLS